MNVCGVLIWRGCNDQQVCVQSVPGMWADGKWSPKESQSILRWVFPLMVRRRRYGSLTCDRNTNPPPPPTPCEWLLMRGSCQRRGLPRGRGGRSLRIRPMKLFYESGVEDVFWRDPGLLFRSVPLLVNQILEYSTPVPGIEQFSNLVCLLAVDHDGWGIMDLDSLLRLSSRTISRFQQTHMKCGRNTVISGQI